ncbi:polysaccharide chain length determinant protein, PEP-CTERM locus subfamily [Solidesulfovibrio carbinoliphilus subsp. oakridgensis]|uniref:Polysaccharide chain length determinant protein, PEP-CTERM locus subfamily n=1 Tax=Solidesulfovibrio carbinoliphilus subsp. oakridgensis TaxID=694327 RepID=G7QCG0_9BACT|nr:XrtA system polysaccharide chain length determinant [Solidesulfovibrio carbinoliphilus]EHJ46116.1 polysaccharide chain length determinant protein, PEP-CTERM locus subfamily [Solidesulfovibrio carbinoliphilus subsp. oakridgensis]
MSAFLKEFHHYKQLIYLYKELFLAVSLLIMTGAIAVGYLSPKKYEAKSTIFIEQNVITDLVKGIAISPSMQQKIQNLAVSLTSRNLLLPVIKQLDKDITLKTAYDQEVYIKDLQRRIMVNLNERQGLIVLNFSDKDPRFARDFINTMARVYIERNTSTKREESTEATKFLAEQIETFKKRVDAADEAINAFRSERGMLLSSDGAFIRSEIKAAEQKLEELSLRRAQLEAQRKMLASGKGPAKASRASSGGNPREAELRRLLAVYTEKNPKVIKARAAAKAWRPSGGGGGESAGEGVAEGTRNAQILQYQLDSIKAMEDYQNKIIGENKGALRDLPRVKATLAELVNKKDQEAAIYNQLVNRYGQSEISKEMELKDKSVMFRIVDPAVIPEVPVSPNRPVIILIGIVLGLGAGAGATYLADRFNHSIRSLHELRTLGLPVFAVIPRISSEKEIRRQARRDHLVMAVAGGYFALVVGVLVLETLRAQGVGTAWLQKIAHSIL